MFLVGRLKVVVIFCGIMHLLCRKKNHFLRYLLCRGSLEASRDNIGCFSTTLTLKLDMRPTIPHQELEIHYQPRNSSAHEYPRN